MKCSCAQEASRITLSSSRADDSAFILRLKRFQSLRIGILTENSSTAHHIMSSIFLDSGSSHPFALGYAALPRVEPESRQSLLPSARLSNQMLDSDISMTRLPSVSFQALNGLSEHIYTLQARRLYDIPPTIEAKIELLTLQAQRCQQA
jgi:hypothetical protein